MADLGVAFTSDVQFTALPAGDSLEASGLLIADLDALDLAQARALHGWVRAGGRLILLPVDLTQADRLAALLGRPVAITEAPVYQVAPLAAPLTAGITPHDLYLFEKASYTQPPKS